MLVTTNHHWRQRHYFIIRFTSHSPRTVHIPAVLSWIDPIRPDPNLCYPPSQNSALPHTHACYLLFTCSHCSCRTVLHLLPAAVSAGFVALIRCSSCCCCAAEPRPLLGAYAFQAQIFVVFFLFWWNNKSEKPTQLAYNADLPPQFVLCSSLFLLCISVPLFGNVYKEIIMKE